MNLDHTIERIATRSINHVNHAVRATDITRIHVAGTVATFQIPKHQYDVLIAELNFFAIDFHADRAQISVGKNRVDESLHERCLSRRKHAHHADLFQNHRSPPGGKGVADTATLKETLRLILARSRASGDVRGLAVATASSNKRDAGTPEARRALLTPSTRAFARF